MTHRTKLPKGVWFQRKRLATGELIRYGYYGRGAGTQPLGREGTAEFHARLAAVLERGPEDGRVSKLIWRYKSSTEFRNLRERTQADYRKQLDKIQAKFGKLSIAAMAAPQIAEHVFAWRDKLAETSPRQADYAISVLSAMLSWCLARGLISHNRAAGVGDVYSSDRSGKVWTPEQEAAVIACAQEPIARALVLATETGLAQEDLLVLPWSAIEGDVVVTRRLKNGTPVAIPISTRLKAVLELAPRGLFPNVLTKSDGTPWDAKGNGIRSAFREACQAAGVTGLTFHDMRGTFITRRRALGWTAEEVALCSGHKVASEKGAQSAYVDRAAVARANAKRLAERSYGAKPEPQVAETGTPDERNLQTGVQTAAEQ